MACLHRLVDTRSTVVRSSVDQVSTEVSIEDQSKVSIDTRPQIRFVHVILGEKTVIQNTNISVIVYFSGPPLNITIDMSVVHLGKVREIDMVCIMTKNSLLILIDITITYLLLTEFEGRTVSHGPSFFPFDLWPKRLGHKSKVKKRGSVT